MNDTLAPIDFWVTQLDAFYWHKRDGDEEKLINQLLRRGEKTDAMTYGIAFHQMLEQESKIAKYETGVMTFAEGQRVDLDKDMSVTNESGQDIEVQLRGGEAEKWGRIEFPEANITLSGKADIVFPDFIVDYKTTGSTYRKIFEESMQWRTYLQMFDKEKFIYRVFRLSPIDEDGMHRRILEYREVEYDRYPRMERDLRAAVYEAAEFCRDRGLDMAKKKKKR